MAPTSSGGAPSPRIRVLVAEDSTTVRRLLVELLRGDPAFEVVAEAGNGLEAVAQAIALRPDLVTMDIHMPLLDGLDATKEIMREVPTPILIVSSVATTSDVGLGFSATQAGALMVVPKPEHPHHPDFARDRDHFLAMARLMAGVKVVRRTGRRGEAATPPLPATRRTPARQAVRAVAIGTSTGGPAALRRLLLDVPARFPAPILVVQHIARGFVGGLAEWLGANVALGVTVATDGAPLRAGVVHLAPDDRHLGVVVDATAPLGRVVLLDREPVGSFRPSATTLFESCAQAYGARLAAIVLTGMGNDGVAGLGAVRRAGGRVLAQDEASSVVFGMAQEAVRAGVVDELLPLDALGSRLLELVEEPA
jgi:two-component system chemotaxis response regulator CheB